MNHPKHSYYKVGLEPQIYFRSRLIFSIITLLILTSSVSGLYAGIKSGKINELVVEPVKSLVKELTTSTPTPELQDVTKLRYSTNNVIEINSTSSSTIKINGKEVNQTLPKSTVKYTYPTPY